jgi:hypothetical protein
VSHPPETNLSSNPSAHIVPWGNPLLVPSDMVQMGFTEL